MNFNNFLVCVSMAGVQLTKVNVESESVAGTALKGFFSVCSAVN